MVELLNFQWIHGEPSKSLDRAGVLVHVFDNTEASEPWLPCPQTSWCARFGDRISASMINQHLPGMFAANGLPPTGIVLSSQLTRVLCSYFADGGSMNKQCDGPPTEGCVPGCIDKFHHWCDSRDVRVFDRNVDVYHCAYTPEDLDAMLQRHLDSYGVSGVRTSQNQATKGSGAGWSVGGTCIPQPILGTCPGRSRGMRERAAGCFVQIVEVGGSAALIDIIGRAQTRFRSVTPSKFCPK